MSAGFFVKGGGASVAVKAAGEDLSTLGPEIEYRSTVDDAWYTVRLSRRNETLRVTFCQFSDVEDEHFTADRFSSYQEITAFSRRFRPYSPQVQDSCCREVRRGTRVCASCDDRDTCLYYDALVEDVLEMPHLYDSTDGEEECKCEFLLAWLHGPKAGTITLARIANISCVQPEPEILDPRLTSYLRMLEDNLPIGLSCPPAKKGRIDQGNGSSRCKDNSQCAYQGGYLAHQTVGEVDLGGGCSHPTTSLNNKHPLTEHVHPPRAAVHSPRADDATNLARADVHPPRADDATNNISSYRQILIDNLEKDLMPSSVESFIFDHTLIRSKAFVFFSSSSESYTRGIIVVDDAVKFQKILDFILNPTHIIVSSKGRPWLFPDPKQYDTYYAAKPSMQLNAMCMKAEVGGQLKIVHSGSSEYNKAEQLRNLYTEFADHLTRLRGRLGLEERLLAMSLDSV